MDRGEEGDMTSVPLMYSGQSDGGGHKRPSDGWDDEGGEEGKGGGEAPMVAWAGGKVKIMIRQPVLAQECSWGELAGIRFEVEGPIRFPDDGVVVFFFDGKEREVMGFSRGEFSAYSRQAGEKAHDIV